MLRHWFQLVPNMTSEDIKQHYLPTYLPTYLAEAAADRTSRQTVHHDTRLAVGDFVYVRNRGAGHARLQYRWRPGIQVVTTRPFAETQVYTVRPHSGALNGQ